MPLKRDLKTTFFKKDLKITFSKIDFKTPFYYKCMHLYDIWKKLRKWHVHSCMHL